MIATYRGQLSPALEDLSSSANLYLHPLEVTDEKAVQSFAASIADHIDVLINNAGVIGPEDQSLTQVTEKDWLETFAVNTIAPLSISRAFLPHLKRSERPRIVTISSMMGSLSDEGTGMYAYRSSKAAVNKVMQVLSLELREDGITVCPVHPGWVQTDMGGANAEITPQASVAGIIALVDKLTLDMSGQFYTWEGKEHPW
ncbi:SDR family oxidoreductase [Photobacterium sp. GJ3]|uniref:SDR family oxidoreductase n=1 Tax=Photobacterium sp. GJ3 TaxID=2829502 RepID=UPI002013A8DF|nr:SDR family oxidoreductase [Photobacterium sp. GJ3]